MGLLRDSVAYTLFKRPYSWLDATEVQEVNNFIDRYNEVNEYIENGR